MSMEKTEVQAMQALSTVSEEKTKIPPCSTQKTIKDRSVVKISVAGKYSPESSTQRWSGSGFILSGKRIVTNAHVAGNFIYAQAALGLDHKKYKVRLLHKNDDCDLALLTVDDPAFWEKTMPLELGKMPDGDQEVTVSAYGYPIGGKDISITSGPINRTEMSSYAHSGVTLLCSQIGASINPGNSGGPVIHEGKVIGVTHQGCARGNGLNYMIPIEVLDHFLTECSKGKVLGFPTLQLEYQPLHNSIMKSYFGLKPTQTGIRISKLSKVDNAYCLLQKNDIILAIDGHPVQDNGTISLPISNLIDFTHLFKRKFIGDQVTLLILRDKKELSVQVKLEHTAGAFNVVTKKEPGAPSTYFIHSGIKLCALDEDYCNNPHSSEHLVEYVNVLQKKPGEQVVFVREVLLCDATQGYDEYEDEVVKKINGIEINNLRDAMSAMEGNKTEIHTIQFFGSKQIILINMKQKEHSELMAQYSIKCDRSVDLCPQGAQAAEEPATPEENETTDNDIEEEEETMSPNLLFRAPTIRLANKKRTASDAGLSPPSPATGKRLKRDL